MFFKLKKIELLININKCEFFKIEIIFFDVILFTNDLRMNFNKIQNIVNWKRFTCLKKIQIFVKFCNFYRRFIKVFSHLIKFLIKMTRKKIDFEWTNFVNDVFEILKKYVIETFILRHYNRKKKSFWKLIFRIDISKKYFLNTITMKNCILLFFITKKWFSRNAITRFMTKSFSSLFDI